MFQFTGLAATRLWIQRELIREPQDQHSFVNSPGLIADFHALHRLLTPRHPPYALSSLTTIIQSSPFPSIATRTDLTPLQESRPFTHLRLGGDSSVVPTNNDLSIYEHLVRQQLPCSRRLHHAHDEAKPIRDQPSRPHIARSMKMPTTSTTKLSKNQSTAFASLLPSATMSRSRFLPAG
jgi:hypothetical protein